MPGRPLVVAKLVGYLSGEVATYVGTRGFTTKPTDTPADQHYKPLLTRIASIRRDCWDILTTSGRSRVGYGNAELRNVAPNKDAAGILDYLSEYAFDGRTFEQWYGLEGTAFPSAFTQITKATMVSMRLTRQKATIALRDRQAELNVQLQPNKYAGDNSLPGGLEGGPELKDKPKPWCFGTVFNVPAVCVNTSKNIFQVHDGAVASVSAVRDGGARLLGSSSLGWTSDIQLYADFSNLRGALYSSPQDLFIAMSAFGPLTSPDGESWTLRTVPTPPSILWEGVFAGKGNIVVATGRDASGTKGIASSTDCIGWSPVSNTSFVAGDDIFSGAYSSSLDLYVVVGSGGKIATSPDLITWTQRANPFSGTTNIRRVAWSPSLALFVAAGSAGEMATSTDGVTWTSRTSGFGATNILSVSWSATAALFVAVGDSGKLTTSTNGTSWTARTSSFGSDSVWDVTYCAPLAKWVAVGAAMKAASSPDGTTWTAITPPSDPDAASVTYQGVASSPSLVVANTLYLGATHTGVRVTTIEPIVVTYASQADLLDDTKEPAPSSWGFYLAGGMIRTGSTPAGQLTTDVTQGANAAARTGGQLFATVMVQAGLGSEYSTADVTTLDSKNSSVLGFWQGTEETNCNVVLDALCDTLGAWWAPDRLGMFRIKRLEDPRTQSPSYTLYAYDFVKPLELRQSNDQNDGIPPWKFTLGYSHNYTVQDSGLFGVVDTADRLLYGQEWQTTSAEDASIVTRHLLSQPRTINTLFTTKADADAEAARRLALHGTDRLSFEGGIRMDATRLGIDLGDIVEVIHPRFGLSGGLSLSVMMQEPVHAVGEQKYINLGIWG